MTNRSGLNRVQHSRRSGKTFADSLLATTATTITPTTVSPTPNVVKTEAITNTLLKDREETDVGQKKMFFWNLRFLQMAPLSN